MSEPRLHELLRGMSRRDLLALRDAVQTQEAIASAGLAESEGSMTPAEIRSRIAAAREWCDAKIIASSQIASLLEILDSGAVFIAVPDGEECEWQELEDSVIDGLFIVDGQLCCRDRGTMGKVVAVSTGADSHIYDEDIVRPVRLVPLAELP